MLKYNKKIYSCIIVIVFVPLVVMIVKLYPFRKEIRITGKIMGTTYDIKVIGGLFKSKSNLQTRISNRFNEINSSFSTYDAKSEISQFNFIRNLEDKFYPSDDFFNLLLISKKLYEITNGAWDPTIGAIVNAWGFGRDDCKNLVLESGKINALLSKVGFEKAIVFCNDGSIKKGFKDVYIDLASIAKGFGVDQISLLLHKEGFKNFLVEIGGEIYAKGYRKDGQFWQIGINHPTKTSSRNDIYKVITLSDMAIATSGNYRNFVQINDKFYSHIIDPKTGYPISNYVTSVSVIAPNCTIADGLATALMVAGPNHALPLVNSLPLVECIVTTEEDNGILRSYSSNGIKAFQH